MRIKILNEVFTDIVLVKEFFWNKVLLFQEPHKDKTSDETDATLMVELLIIFCRSQVVGETGHLNSPGIPVAEF